MDPINEAYNIVLVNEASSMDDLIIKLKRIQKANNSKDFSSLICDCIKKVFEGNPKEYKDVCKNMKEGL